MAIIGFAGLVSAASSARSVSAQPTTSVWSGVYTAAQAARGRIVYETHCGRCHGDDLNAVDGSPLAGGFFMRKWETRTLERLFRRIRDTMPPGDAASVDADDKRDVIAYLLQRNGFPDGTTDLPQDASVLASIQIISRNGPAAPTTGALVRVIGCLAESRDRGWVLTSATEPERTTLDARTSDPSEAIDSVRAAFLRSAAGTDPSGSGVTARTVQLLNVFPIPTMHLGHAMEAKGFLVRRPDGDAVNVVSLEMIASTCR